MKRYLVIADTINKGSFATYKFASNAAYECIEKGAKEVQIIDTLTGEKQVYKL